MIAFDRLPFLGLLSSSRRTGCAGGALHERTMPALSPDGLADLAGLRALLPEAEVLRFRDAPVLALADDSRQAASGSVFFAVPGTRLDGAAFAAEAVGRGAVAVVAARPLPLPVPVFVVPDVRRAAARAAAAFYREPSRVVPVAGVTGTNGKTSTALLLARCLEEHFGKAGCLGTVGHRLGLSGGEPEIVLPAARTTPGPIAVQRLLRQMVDRGARALVVEASSHALDQGRVEAVAFKAAVFTNLSRDHLDYHGTMAAYAEAKARLFRGLAPGAIAVLPADDPAAEAMRAALPPGVRLSSWAFGRGRAGLRVRAELRGVDLEGTSLRLFVDGAEVPVRLPWIGRHAARNAVAAFTCAVELGVGPLRAAAALADAPPVPGRLERVGDRRAGFAVFVDYAHTPDALRAVLAALRPLAAGRLLLLFGCGGDRDRGKRPEMAAVAAAGADLVVLTNDNPRGEDPARILADIRAGIPPEAAGRFTEVPDRRRAIRKILGAARRGDVVLIAGKGHETGQEIAGRVLPFDDREEVGAWFRRN